MCNYKMLVRTNYGYAAQCLGCNHVELAFGTSVMRFHIHPLSDFLRYLEKVRDAQSLVNNGRKNIILDIASIDSFQMILTYDELSLLCKMTENAEIELQASALLGLFKAG